MSYSLNAVANAPKDTKPKATAAAKKGPAKKKVCLLFKPSKWVTIYCRSLRISIQCFWLQFQANVVDTDEEDEVRELKERLAAYNLDSSPEHNCNYSYHNVTFSFFVFTGSNF